MVMLVAANIRNAETNGEATDKDGIVKVTK